MIKQISFMENIYIGSSVNIVVLSKKESKRERKANIAGEKEG